MPALRETFNSNLPDASGGFGESYNKKGGGENQLLEVVKP